MLAGPNRLAGVGFGRPGQNRHAAGGLVGDDLDDPPPLFGREPRELAGRAVGVQAVHAALDQPVDVAPQFRLVDLAPLIERHDVRREDALQALLEVGHEGESLLWLR